MCILIIRAIGEVNSLLCEFVTSKALVMNGEVLFLMLQHFFQQNTSGSS